VCLCVCLFVRLIFQNLKPEVLRCILAFASAILKIDSKCLTVIAAPCPCEKRTKDHHTNKLTNINKP
jgi:hypothetical protein